MEGEDEYIPYDDDEPREQEQEVEDEDQVVFDDEPEEPTGAVDDEGEPSFEQLQNMRYRETGGAIVEGISKGLQRSLRSPEENAKAALQIFLADKRFEGLRESRTEAVIKLVENLKNLPLLSTEILTFAALWRLEERKLSSKELQNFCSKYKVHADNQVDIVRYLRMLDLELRK